MYYRTWRRGGKIASGVPRNQMIMKIANVPSKSTDSLVYNCNYICKLPGIECNML